jgi:hypothetical protein
MQSPPACDLHVVIHEVLCNDSVLHCALVPLVYNSRVRRWTCKRGAAIGLLRGSARSLAGPPPPRLSACAPQPMPGTPQRLPHNNILRHRTSVIIDQGRRVAQYHLEIEAHPEGFVAEGVHMQGCLVPPNGPGTVLECLIYAAAQEAHGRCVAHPLADVIL